VIERDVDGSKDYKTQLLWWRFYMSSPHPLSTLLPAAFVSGTLLLCAFALHGAGIFVTTAEADQQTISEDVTE
jgi:hypothetical protein